MTHQVIYPKSRTTRQLRKRVPLPNGFTTEPDGTEEIYFQVLLDTDGLAEMARKAAASKSQVSNYGALRVRILSRRKL